MWKQKMLVMATMVLHNYVREHANGNVDFERVECDEDYEPTILERYNKYIVPWDSSTTLSNAPTMDNFRDISNNYFSRLELVCNSVKHIETHLSI
jgi:hypothetical protein